MNKKSMTEYKLIALDIDGTLARSDKSISPATKEALIRAQEMGLRVVISSGRPTYGIVPLADELRLAEHDGFILAYNGGAITDVTTGECLYAKTLPRDVVPFLYQCAKENGFDIMCYDDDHIITENANNEYIQISSARNRMRIVQVDDFLSAIDFDIYKCMIVGEPDRLKVLADKMASLPDARYYAIRSEPFYLEVVPSGIDKGVCLGALIDRLGIDRSELIACGDGFNDKSMIEFAGLGVAMANAQQCVKDAANFVTLSNDEDGIVHVLNKFYFR